MPLFHAIAAMSENRVIGDQGKIPWHIPEDFRWFKHKTMGGTLVMGRKTFESIGKPLPGRKTIVLTRQSLDIPGVEVQREAEKLIRKLSEQIVSEPKIGLRVRYPVGEESPVTARTVVWVCGGAEIYRQLLPECMTLHLTRVKREVPGDTFFPPFESDFDLEQVIHETETFRVERWHRKSWTHYTANEPWPFTQ